MATEETVHQARLSAASAVNVAGLLAFGAMIVVQTVGGVVSDPLFDQFTDSFFGTLPATDLWSSARL